MKRYLILICLLGILSACGQEEDTRFFAPEAGFGQAAYTVKSEAAGGLDVSVTLSRPAEENTEVGVTATGTLQEGLQFSLSTHTLVFPAGSSSASLHITLVDDEIWENDSYIELILTPGKRYTINPDGNCSARVNVQKDIVLPRYSLVVPETALEINPFIPEPLRFQIRADGATETGMELTLAFGELECGKDYLIDGRSTPVVKYPAGARSTSFELQLMQRDESGIDKHEILSIVPRKGVYAVTAGASDVDIHLSDPQVSFAALFKSPALQNGQGYQIRQAIKGPDGEWNGNTTVDLGVSAEGSNYLRCYRNMYDHPSFSCRANASVSQPLRLSDLFPEYVYPSPTAILDYGNDQGHRQFTPVDSLLRFVASASDPSKGTICLTKPRVLTARIGSYAEWQKEITGGKTWVVDSRANGGDIMASTHSALTGTISVTVHKIEGTFDFSDSSAPVLITAWLSSDSDRFLQGIDDTKIAATQDGGMWKIEYKLWPR